MASKISFVIFVASAISLLLVSFGFVKISSRKENKTWSISLDFYTTWFSKIIYFISFILFIVGSTWWCIQ